MKLEPNMYVRTNKGIYKLNHFINNNYTQKFTYIDNCGCSEFLEEKQVIKASYNIIDLIEVGDYVNGYKIIHKGFDDNRNNQLFIDWNETEKSRGGTCIPLENIKSIVTKEQFESMSYKVGE